MYRVALVQNQSEMAHYSHADCRSFFTNIGYTPVLYTGENVADLAEDLYKQRLDGIIFSSNCFNDKIIRNTVFGAPTSSKIRGYIERGGGVIIFHQLRLAQQRCAHLPFLPDEIANLSLMARPKGEPATTGRLEFGPAGQGNTCSLYPQELNIDDIERRNEKFQGLPGLYWHYVSASRFDHWDVLIEDKTIGEQARQLLLLTKDTIRFRVVVCALPADWQRVDTLVKNVCVYAIEGPHSIAIIKNNEFRSNAFEFFLESLHATKFPHRIYSTTSDQKEFIRNINNNIHSEFVFSPFVSEASILPELMAAIEEKTKSGLAKKIQFDTQAGIVRSFSVTGRERFSRRLLAYIELRVAEELTHGYIDESFWATVESLQCLKDIPFSQFDYASLGATLLELCDQHDRDGSYDEVIGASCALLWLRHYLLGNQNEATQNTARWIRARNQTAHHREQVLALSTLVECGLAESSERELLERILHWAEVPSLSETDLLVYLNASLLIGRNAFVQAFARGLVLKQQDGKWTDLDITATATNLLIVALRRIKDERSVEEPVEKEVRQSIFSGMIYLRSALPIGEARVPDRYPWEGKASASLKCLRAWTRFDEFIDFPVNELFDTLTKVETLSRIAIQGAQNISVLRSVIEERNRLLAQNKELAASSATQLAVQLECQRQVAENTESLEFLKTNLLPKVKRQRNFSLIAISIISYIMILIIYTLATDPQPTLTSVMYKVSIGSYAIHVGALAVLFSVVRVPWSRIVGWLMARNDEQSRSARS
jgi:hypothetical protein